MKAQIWLAVIPLVAFCRCAKPESQSETDREIAQPEPQEVLRESTEKRWLDSESLRSVFIMQGRRLLLFEVCEAL